MILLTKPYWPRILAAVILSFMLSGISGAIAWSIKPALDRIIVKKEYEYLKLLPVGVFLLFGLKGVISFAQAYLLKSASVKLVREMRNRLYIHILYLPLRYFSKESSGVIISRVISDVKMLGGLVSDIGKTFIVEVPTVIFLIGIALYRSVTLTLISLSVVPVIAYSTRIIGTKIKKRAKKAQRKGGILTQLLGETVQGNRIIKIFNREGSMNEKFVNESHRIYSNRLKMVRFKESTVLIADVVIGVGLAFVLWFGTNMVISGVITSGDFASLMMAIYMIFSPVKKISDGYTSFQEVMASYERVETLLNYGHEDTGHIKISSFRDSIDFENISFVYQGNKFPVLKDLNLKITRGEIVAIVGKSGVGKSTLVDLIPRFNKATGGVIKIDGIDINEVEIHSLRELIGIVSQDVILFNDSIRENISFGRPGAAESEIIEAARLAYADEFINELPEKYGTIIGERGLKLSGGQRQRIAIARAILKNPPILILDEATSSLDSVSEALVQKALESLMKDRTTIVIAHRLSTIKNADRIIMLDGGEISGCGSHEQLLAGHPAYRQLYMAYAGPEAS